MVPGFFFSFKSPCPLAVAPRAHVPRGQGAIGNLAIWQCVNSPGNRDGGTSESGYVYIGTKVDPHARFDRPCNNMQTFYLAEKRKEKRKKEITKQKGSAWANDDR